MSIPKAEIGVVFPGTASELRIVTVADDYSDDPRNDCFSAVILSPAQALAVAQLVRDNPEQFSVTVRKELVKA